MLKALKFLLGGLGGLFGGFFSIFGHIVQTVARTPMAMLEFFGLVQPAPQMWAAEEAEAAAGQAQHHFGSALDKKPVTWTQEQRAVALADWCEWRTGARSGPEPSLAGFSTRERLKLRAADEKTIQVLPLRTTPAIEEWLHSPNKALEPLTQEQLKTVMRQVEQQDRERAEAIARWNAITDHLDAREESRTASTSAETDNVIRLAEEALNFRPAGPAYA